MKAVLFDMDGTLIRSGEAHYHANKELASMLGLEYTREIHERFYGRRGVDILVALGASREDAERVMRKKGEVLKKYLSYVEPLVTREEIESLKRKCKVGIVTSGSRDTLDILLKHVGIPVTMFDVIITAEDVEKGKPDPEPILKALEILGIPPEEAIYVGDTEHDREAAERAGVCFIHIRDFDFRCE